MQTAAAAPLDVQKYLDPNVKYAQEQAASALSSSAAARGNLLSGGATRALSTNATNIANSNWNNATQLALQDRQSRSSINSNLAGFGDTALNAGLNLYNNGINAIGQQANVVSGQGINSSNLAMTGANVAARGDIAQASAITSGVGQLVGLFSDEKAKQPVATPDKVDPNAFKNLMGNWGSSTVPRASTPRGQIELEKKLATGDTSSLRNESSGEFTRTIYFQGKPITVPITSSIAPPPTAAPAKTGAQTPGWPYGMPMDQTTADRMAMIFSDEDSKQMLTAQTDDEIDQMLSKLHPKEFEYNPKAIAAGAPEGPHTGIIAQDLEKSKIGKRLVKQDSASGFKQVDVPQSVGTLLAATASLNKRIKKLEGKK